MQTDKFDRGFKSKAEKISLEYREKIGVKPWSPLCAFKLAELLDVIVLSPSDILDSREDIEKICGTPNKNSGWSALIMSPKEGRRIIIHNTNHSSTRQQSNLMHEIAHIICGHSIPAKFVEMRLPFAMPYSNKKDESEAAYLGGALQLSKPCLFWALKRNMSIKQIAEYFNASEEMVKYRIGASGVGYQKGILSRKAS